MADNSGSAADLPAIGLIPYGTKLSPRLASMSLDALYWPIGRPERLSAGTISSMRADDHLIAYVNSTAFYMPRPGVRAKLSIMIVEPQAVHGRNMFWARLLWWRFFRVLSCNAKLLASLPNGERFLFGSTWVPDFRDLKIEKTKMTSLIASEKTHYPGHKLRHQVVNWLRGQDLNVDIMGRGYAPFERKSDGLAPFRYSVIIENVREPSHFTEKLIDCLLCETVPIYWGAQDIETIFEPGGLLVCNSFDEIKAALATASTQDYQARLASIARNKEIAARYANHELAAARIVQLAARRNKSKS